jgi:hypothetical protein
VKNAVELGRMKFNHVVEASRGRRESQSFG